MATEILASAPQASSSSEGTEPQQLVVSEDLTITGKNRKKRFRLR